MKPQHIAITLVITACVLSCPRDAVAGAVATIITREEHKDRSDWIRRRLTSTKPFPSPVGLFVRANHDPVTRKSRGGRPLRIADKQYRRGLYCHAVSKVVVHLPSPGKTFSAVVGVDSNEQTKGGRGSVVFSVSAHGRQLYRSKLMRKGMAGEKVNVALAGATSFTLDVANGGDGISCDQSDWADAKVILADGKELWVGDLPFVSAAQRGGPPLSFTYGGKPSSQLLPAWPRKDAREKIDNARTRHTRTWTDKRTGLVVRCVTIEYHDFPTVEWTVYFKNAGTKDTPILADIQPLDTSFSRGPKGEFLLHHHVGSTATINDYRPLQTPLRANGKHRFASSSGRGSDGGQKMLYLGNAKARKWLTDHVDKLMTDEGIDIYRQDCNFNLLGYWRANDADDRQGITEIRHVTGYLAYWDELRRRRPGLLIDTCASGGRRNDLETLRRSVPLHKSDMEYPNLTSKQTQFYGLAFWVPYFGAPVYPADRVDTYGFRSGIAPMTGLGYDTRRKDYDYALLRKLVAEWKLVVPNYYGDYWPLTPWRAELDVWMAWQFDRPEAGRGVVQAFRRPKSPCESARFVLRGLDPSAWYEVRNVDVEGSIKLTGRELMGKGLLVSIRTRPGAAIVFYRRLKQVRLRTGP